MASTNKPYEGMKGQCSVCMSSNVALHPVTGMLKYHRRHQNNQRVNCEGSGHTPRRITYDPANQVAKIAHLHESTVQRAPELAERFRRLAESPKEDRTMAMRASGEHGWCAYCHRYMTLKVSGKIRSHKPAKYHSASYPTCPGMVMTPLQQKPTGPSPFDLDKARTKEQGGLKYTQQDMDDWQAMAQEDADKALAGRLAEVRQHAVDTIKGLIDLDQPTVLDREAVIALVAGLQLIDTDDEGKPTTARHMSDGRWQTPTGEWLYTQQDMEDGLAETKTQLESEVRRAAELNKSNLELVTELDATQADAERAKGIAYEEHKRAEQLKEDVLVLEHRIQLMQDTEAQYEASQEADKPAKEWHIMLPESEAVQRAVEDRDQQWLAQLEEIRASQQEQISEMQSSLDQLRETLQYQLDELSGEVEALRAEQRQATLRTAIKPKKAVNKKKLRKLASNLLEELEVL